MRRIFIVASLAMGSLAFAQAGKIGVNNASPEATLDIQIASDNGNTPEGLLIPRVSRTRLNAMTETPNAANSVKPSTMIYVNAIDGSANTQTANVDAVGFYYYNGTIWVKMGAGAAAAADNLYTANGTLTSARTVTQNDQNLTFKTGTNGQMIVDGTSNLKGAQYASIRPQTLPMSAADWQANDYAVVLTGSGTLSLPAPGGTNVNRIISFSNQSGGTLNITGNPPLNNSTIEGGKGFIVMSNGTNWVCIGGY